MLQSAVSIYQNHLEFPIGIDRNEEITSLPTDVLYYARELSISQIPRSRSFGPRASAVWALHSIPDVDSGNAHVNCRLNVYNLNDIDNEYGGKDQIRY